MLDPRWSPPTCALGVPYSLALSARRASDATRTFRDGILNAVVPAGRGVAWQRPDGVVCLRATGEEALDQLRFCLALDDDHTPFVLRFQRDPLLGATVRRLRGLRPVRLATVAQALLRALCGQLILASEARAMERRIVRAATERRDGLSIPPTTSDLARFSPAELRRARPPRPPRRHARAADPLARARASEGRADRRGLRPAPARARSRPVVARRRLPRGTRPFRPRPRGRPRPREAAGNDARPPGRGVGDGRAARAVR